MFLTFCALVTSVCAFRNVTPIKNKSAFFQVLTLSPSVQQQHQHHDHHHHRQLKEMCDQMPSSPRPAQSRVLVVLQQPMRLLQYVSNSCSWVPKVQRTPPAEHGGRRRVPELPVVLGTCAVSTPKKA